MKGKSLTQIELHSFHEWTLRKCAEKCVMLQRANRLFISLLIFQSMPAQKQLQNKLKVPEELLDIKKHKMKLPAEPKMIEMKNHSEIFLCSNAEHKKSHFIWLQFVLVGCLYLVTGERL